MSTNVPNASVPATLIQRLHQTPPAQIAELDFVRDKYVANYNACHKEKQGELMYHRQLVHFKQAITNEPKLQKCDPFTLYACFLNAAVNGYSLDPEDNEVYLYPYGTKAKLQRQAGAHVKRLMRTGQIQYAEQAKLVYRGDDFKVVNGRVTVHEERFQSEEVIAGYAHMILDQSGKDIYFIYRPSDWQAWKKKSPQAGGENWSGGFNGGPLPAFLRTKIIKHACQEKCWATGNSPVHIEKYDVEVDDEDMPPPDQHLHDQSNGTYGPAAAEMQNDDSFVQQNVAVPAGVVHNDDDF